MQYSHVVQQPVARDKKKCKTEEKSKSISPPFQLTYKEQPR
jgi:hypothetical protein